MKNLLIALLSVTVVVMTFLLWKSQYEPKEKSFGFSEEYDKYLKEDLKLEYVSVIDSNTRKLMVKSYVDSLVKYRSNNLRTVNKDSVERYVYFSIPELDSLMKQLPTNITRKDYKFKVYLGHYAENADIINYLLKATGKPLQDIRKNYLNRNTVILQLVDPNGKNTGIGMNVGSICPPKCLPGD